MKSKFLFLGFCMFSTFSSIGFAEKYCPAELNWNAAENEVTLNGKRFFVHEKMHTKCSDNIFDEPGPNFIPFHGIKFLDHALQLDHESVYPEQNVCVYSKKNAEAHVVSRRKDHRQAPEDAIVHCDSKMLLKSKPYQHESFSKPLAPWDVP